MKVEPKYTLAQADSPSHFDNLAQRSTGPVSVPTLTDLKAEALVVLRENGLDFDDLELDAGWRRKPHHDHLWYQANSETGGNGRPWLMVTAGDAKTTGDVCTPLVMFKSWEAAGRSVTPNEITEIERQVETATHERKEKEEERRRAAAATARHTWDNASEDTHGHPYLETKDVKAHGLRQQDDRLLVPLRDVEGNLHGYQSISPDGKHKRFNPGASVSGHVHLIEEPVGVIYLTEGYATGATIHEATEKAVAVCFNASNLEPAAKALRTAYPAAELTVCGDNDQWTEGNPGKTKAEAAAAVSCAYVVPVFHDTTTKPTDFNDLARLEGLIAVPAQLQRTALVEETREATVERLAKLLPMDYDPCREKEAHRLGVRVATLDEAVMKRRVAKYGDASQGQSIGCRSRTDRSVKSPYRKDDNVVGRYDRLGIGLRDKPPSGIESPTLYERAEGQDGLTTLVAPAHPRAFHALRHQRLARRLNDA